MWWLEEGSRLQEREARLGARMRAIDGTRTPEGSRPPMPRDQNKKASTRNI